MQRLLVLLALSLLPLASTQAQERPNIVVIMVDDMGYSDLGCYGSEIETPNLDALADSGLRFSQFYNTAKCHSSRVSLLTGQYCIAAGDTALTNAVTSAEVLGQAGYFTAMTGKWHLKQQPTDFGFQRYFGHLSGACNFFKGDNTFRLNGEKWNVPNSDFYTTVANVDFALEFLEEARETDQPWYLYVAFNAPHAPLHALPEDYKKYKGKYAEGWDIIRDRRFEKQKQLGLLPEDLQISPRPEHVSAWSEMEEWRQEYEANRMTTLAAMIDRVDQEVGRLVEDLRSNGELDNTFILFVSDNGACPYDRKRPQLDVEPTNGDISLADSTGWSWARNCPFRYYKQNQFEGGISTPAIVHWPVGLKTSPGSINHDPAHLIDVLPTLVDITSAEVPADWPNRQLREMNGVSLKPILDGEPLGDRPPIHLLFSKDRGLRDGDWKAVSFRGQAWELYNVREDRTELLNLANTEPARLAAMIETWTDMSQNVLQANPRLYSPATEAQLPHRHPEWTNFDTERPSTNSGPGNQRNPSRNGGIRARKNTLLDLKEGMLHLEFTGEDPGIAMDIRGEEIPTGPYQLTFRLRDGSRAGGEVFFTTDQRTILPRGENVAFDIVADGNWQEVVVDIETDKRIHQLRIDVCPAEGSAVIADLKLVDLQGRTVKQWPTDSNGR